MCALFVDYFVGSLLYRHRSMRRCFLQFLSLMNLDRKVLRTINGQRMFINPKRSLIDLRLYFCGTHEPYITSFFLSQIREGMTIVDIGGHIGYFSLLAAQHVGNNGRVIVFEPDPANYQALLDNIKLNGYENIDVYQYAISNMTERRSFSFKEDGVRHSFLTQPGDQTRDVETITLDDFFKEKGITECDLIKMDIEGAEILALEGMNKTLMGNKNIKLIIEVHRREILDLGSKVEYLFDLLNEHDFFIYSLKDDGSVKRHDIHSANNLSGHIYCSRESLHR